MQKKKLAYIYIVWPSLTCLMSVIWQPCPGYDNEIGIATRKRNESNLLHPAAGCVSLEEDASYAARSSYSLAFVSVVGEGGNTLMLSGGRGQETNEKITLTKLAKKHLNLQIGLRIGTRVHNKGALIVQ